MSVQVTDVWFGRALDKRDWSFVTKGDPENRILYSVGGSGFDAALDWGKWANTWFDYSDSSQGSHTWLVRKSSGEVVGTMYELEQFVKSLPVVRMYINGGLAAVSSMDSPGTYFFSLYESRGVNGVMAGAEYPKLMTEEGIYTIRIAASNSITKTIQVIDGKPIPDGKIGVTRIDGIPPIIQYDSQRSGDLQGSDCVILPRVYVLNRIRENRGVSVCFFYADVNKTPIEFDLSNPESWGEDQRGGRLSIPIRSPHREPNTGFFPCEMLHAGDQAVVDVASAQFQTDYPGFTNSLKIKTRNDIVRLRDRVRYIGAVVKLCEVFEGYEDHESEQFLEPVFTPVEFVDKNPPPTVRLRMIDAYDMGHDPVLTTHRRISVVFKNETSHTIAWRVYWGQEALMIDGQHKLVPIYYPPSGWGLERPGTSTGMQAMAPGSSRAVHFRTTTPFVPEPQKAYKLYLADDGEMTIDDVLLSSDGVNPENNVYGKAKRVNFNVYGYM